MQHHSILFKIYIHIRRNLFYHSFKLIHVRLIGRVILFLSIAAAFLGYVLLRDQISFTNLLSALPYIGQTKWLNEFEEDFRSFETKFWLEIQTMKISLKQSRTREQRHANDLRWWRRESRDVSQRAVFTVHGRVPRDIGFGIGYNPGACWRNRQASRVGVRRPRPHMPAACLPAKTDEPRAIYIFSRGLPWYCRATKDTYVHLWDGDRYLGSYGRDRGGIVPIMVKPGNLVTIDLRPGSLASFLPLITSVNARLRARKMRFAMRCTVKWNLNNWS